MPPIQRSPVPVMISTSFAGSALIIASTWLQVFFNPSEKTAGPLAVCIRSSTIPSWRWIAKCSAYRAAYSPRSAGATKPPTWSSHSRRLSLMPLL